MASSASGGVVRGLVAKAAKARTPTREKIFLCNWYVKLVKPGKELPRDHVQCHVPMKMNKFDIRNYFEKIYNVRVANVNTRIQFGKEKRVSPTRKKKQADVKIAYLTLEDQTFDFPDIFHKQLQTRDEAAAEER